MLKTKISIIRENKRDSYECYIHPKYKCEGKSRKIMHLKGYMSSNKGTKYTNHVCIQSKFFRNT